MFKHQTEQYNWLFLSLAANEDAIATASHYGIDESNAAQVTLNAPGMQASTMNISRNSKHYG